MEDAARGEDAAATMQDRPTSSAAAHFTRPNANEGSAASRSIAPAKGKTKTTSKAAHFRSQRSSTRLAIVASIASADPSALSRPGNPRAAADSTRNAGGSATAAAASAATADRSVAGNRGSVRVTDTASKNGPEAGSVLSISTAKCHATDSRLARIARRIGDSAGFNSSPTNMYVPTGKRSSPRVADRARKQRSATATTSMADSPVAGGRRGSPRVTDTAHGARGGAAAVTASSVVGTADYSVAGNRGSPRGGAAAVAASCVVGTADYCVAGKHGSPRSAADVACRARVGDGGGNGGGGGGGGGTVSTAAAGSCLLAGQRGSPRMADMERKQRDSRDSVAESVAFIGPCVAGQLGSCRGIDVAGNTGKNGSRTEEPAIPRHPGRCNEDVTSSASSHGGSYNQGVTSSASSRGGSYNQDVTSSVSSHGGSHSTSAAEGARSTGRNGFDVSAWWAWRLEQGRPVSSSEAAVIGGHAARRWRLPLAGSGASERSSPQRDGGQVEAPPPLPPPPPPPPPPPAHLDPCALRNEKNALTGHPPPRRLPSPRLAFPTIPSPWPEHMFGENFDTAAACAAFATANSTFDNSAHAAAGNIPVISRDGCSNNRFTTADDGGTPGGETRRVGAAAVTGAGGAAAPWTRQDGTGFEDAIPADFSPPVPSSVSRRWCGAAGGLVGEGDAVSLSGSSAGGMGACVDGHGGGGSREADAVVRRYVGTGVPYMGAGVRRLGSGGGAGSNAAAEWQDKEGGNDPGRDDAEVVGDMLIVEEDDEEDEDQYEEEEEEEEGYEVVGAVQRGRDPIHRGRPRPVCMVNASGFPRARAIGDGEGGAAGEAAPTDTRRQPDGQNRRPSADNHDEGCDVVRVVQRRRDPVQRGRPRPVCMANASGFPKARAIGDGEGGAAGAAMLRDAKRAPGGQKGQPSGEDDRDVETKPVMAYQYFDSNGVVVEFEAMGPAVAATTIGGVAGRRMGEISGRKNWGEANTPALGGGSSSGSVPPVESQGGGIGGPGVGAAKTSVEYRTQTETVTRWSNRLDVAMSARPDSSSGGSSSGNGSGNRNSAASNAEEGSSGGAYGSVLSDNGGALAPASPCVSRLSGVSVATDDSAVGPPRFRFRGREEKLGACEIASSLTKKATTTTPARRSSRPPRRKEASAREGATDQAAVAAAAAAMAAYQRETSCSPRGADSPVEASTTVSVDSEPPGNRGRNGDGVGGALAAAAVSAPVRKSKMNKTPGASNRGQKKTPKLGGGSSGGRVPPIESHGGAIGGPGVGAAKTSVECRAQAETVTSWSNRSDVAMSTRSDSSSGGRSSGNGSGNRNRAASTAEGGSSGGANGSVLSDNGGALAPASPCVSRLSGVSATTDDSAVGSPRFRFRGRENKLESCEVASRSTENATTTTPAQSSSRAPCRREASARAEPTGQKEAAEVAAQESETSCSPRGADSPVEASTTISIDGDAPGDRRYDGDGVGGAAAVAAAKASTIASIYGDAPGDRCRDSDGVGGAAAAAAVAVPVRKAKMTKTPGVSNRNQKKTPGHKKKQSQKKTLVKNKAPDKKKKPAAAKGKIVGDEVSAAAVKGNDGLRPGGEVSRPTGREPTTMTRNEKKGAIAKSADDDVDAGKKTGGSGSGKKSKLVPKRKYPTIDKVIGSRHKQPPKKSPAKCSFPPTTADGPDKKSTASLPDETPSARESMSLERPGEGSSDHGTDRGSITSAAPAVTDKGAAPEVQNKGVPRAAAAAARGGKVGGGSRGRRRKSVSPATNVKTPEQVELDEFLRTLVVEPPAHVVPDTPTPPMYLGAAADDNNGNDASSAATIVLPEPPRLDPSVGARAREELRLSAETMAAASARPGATNAVWDRRHFVLLPTTVGAASEEGVSQGGSLNASGDTLASGTVPHVGGCSDDVGGLSAAVQIDAGGGGGPGGAVGGVSLEEGADAGGEGTIETLTEGRASCSPTTRKGGGQCSGLALRAAQDKILNVLSLGEKQCQKDLIAPQEYGGEGGYFEHLRQPFKMEVHPSVQLVSDAHANMVDQAEVIGILAGRFDRDAKVLYVQAAVPCLEAARMPGQRGHTEVTMDSVALFHAKEGVARLGLQMVGWYHSHPKFINNPSPIDVDNQAKYQRDENAEGAAGAWVGMIVGRAQSPSNFLWFRNEPAERSDGTTVACPMLLKTRLASSTLSTSSPRPDAAAGATVTGWAGAGAAREHDSRNDGAVSRPVCSATVTVDVGKTGVGRGEDATREVDNSATSVVPPSRLLFPLPSPVTMPVSGARLGQPLSEETKEMASVRDVSGIVDGTACCRAPTKPATVVTCSGRLDGGGGVGGSGDGRGVARGGGMKETGKGEDKRRKAVEQRQRGRALARVEVDRLDGDRRRKNKRLVLAVEAACAASSRKVLEATPAVSSTDAKNPTMDRSPAAAAATLTDDSRSNRNKSLVVDTLTDQALTEKERPAGDDGLDMAMATAEEPVAPVMIALAPEETAGSSAAATNDSMRLVDVLPPATAASANAGVSPLSSGGGVASLLAATTAPPPPAVFFGMTEGLGVVPLVNAGGEASREGVASSSSSSESVGRGGAVSPSSPGVSGADADRKRKVEKRARVFESLGALSRDPPLVFSGEVLRVLKEVEGELGGDGLGDEGGAGGYGPEMDSVVESLTSLGRFYARVPGRAPLSWGNRPGTPALESLARSLAPTVEHMELDPSEKEEFIRDACAFLLSCFRETRVQRTKKRKADFGASPRGVSRTPRSKRSRNSTG